MATKAAYTVATYTNRTESTGGHEEQDIDVLAAGEAQLRLLEALNANLAQLAASADTIARALKTLAVAAAGS
jgi:hypothetical protein